MPTGEILDWNNATGRGVVVRDHASGELMLLRSQCMGIPNIQRGMRITFGIASAPRTGRPMAIDVRLINVAGGAV